MLVPPATAGDATDTSGNAVALPPAQQQAFDDATAALLSGTGGVAFTGAADSGFEVFVGLLIERLSATHAVLTLEAESAPEDIAALLTSAQDARSRTTAPVGVILHVAHAEQLRRDTLDVLNGMPAMLAGHPSMRLLVTGRPTLIARLASNAHQPLLDYLATRIELPGTAPAARVRQVHTVETLYASDSISAPARSKRSSSQRPSLMTKKMATAIGATVLTVAALMAWLQFVPAPRGSSDTQSVPIPPANLVNPASPRPDPSATRPAPPAGSPASGANPTAAQPSEQQVPPLRPTGQLSREPVRLVVRRGDTLWRIYQDTYKGLEGPPFSEVVALNPRVLQPGMEVVMPVPANGWLAP